MRLPYALIVALVVAALFAGCGGGGSDSTESTPTTTETTTALTKADLIEQGDAICAEVNAAVGTVGASSAETGSPSVQAAELYSGMAASLKNLGTPQEAAGYSELTTAADELATAEGEVKLASERGDSAGLEAAESSASAALASFQEAAQEYGFKECAEGPRAPTTSAPEAGGTGSAEAPEEAEAVAPEAEAEPAPEVVPETGGAGGATEGGGTTGGGGGGSSTGGESGGIGPG